jgi:hypothetical protein
MTQSPCPIPASPAIAKSHFLQYRGGTNAGRIASLSTLNPGLNTCRDEQDIHTHYMGCVFVSRLEKTLQNGQWILIYVTISMGKKRPAFQIRQLGLVTLGLKRDMKKRPYKGVFVGAGEHIISRLAAHIYAVSPYPSKCYNIT